MNKLLRLLLISLVLLTIVSMVIRHKYVLSSRELTEAMQRTLPMGASKMQVVGFIEARHPVAYDDTGSTVKARLSGRAENIIYRKDIVVTFEFDAQGRLSSYSTKEYLSFL